MVCNQCGKEIPEDSIFCSYCGAEQPSAPEPAAAELPPPEPYVPSSFDRIFGKLVGVLVLLAILGMIYLFSGNVLFPGGGTVMN